jgi:hypothetical protein
MLSGRCTLYKRKKEIFGDKMENYRCELTKISRVGEPLCATGGAACWNMRQFKAADENPPFSKIHPAAPKAIAENSFVECPLSPHSGRMIPSVSKTPPSGETKDVPAEMRVPSFEAIIKPKDSLLPHFTQLQICIFNKFSLTSPIMPSTFVHAFAGLRRIKLEKK